MLYVITDRRMYGANEAQARACLVEQASNWAANGVAFIQLREKDLSARDQVELARAMRREMQLVQPMSGAPHPTKLLMNGRADVALAAGADGVHLPSGAGALSPDEIRKIFAAAGRMQPPILSVSCHTLQEVDTARQQKPDCILFAPVFEKSILATEEQEAKILPGTGLELLQQACQIAVPIPVFALGGVTAENAAECLRAGAAGIAAIRLLQQPPSIWRNLA